MSSSRRQMMRKARNYESLRRLSAPPPPPAPIVRWDSFGADEKLGKYLTTKTSRNKIEPDDGSSSIQVSPVIADRRALLTRDFSSRMCNKDTASFCPATQASKNKADKREQRKNVKRVPSKKCRRGLFKQTRQQTASRNLFVDFDPFELEAPAPKKPGVQRIDHFGRQRRCISLARQRITRFEASPEYSSE